MKKTLIILLALLAVTLGKVFAQVTISSSPAVGVYTSCPVGDFYGTCNNGDPYFGNTLKIRVMQINGLQVTFTITKCNNGQFTSDGTAYIKSGNPCGGIIAQVPYSAGATSVTMSITMSGQTGSANISGVFVTTSNARYYTDPITITMTNSQQQTYTISTSATPTNGGYTSGNGNFTNGQYTTVTATAYSGYVFTCWKENGNIVSTNASYSFTVSGNRNLVAYFDAQQSQVNLFLNANPFNGGTVSGNGVYNDGDWVTVTALPSQNNTFVSWTLGGIVVSTSPTYSFTLAGNTTLTANFLPIVNQPLAVTGFNSDPTNGAANETQFHFHCNIPNASSFNGLQVYVDFTPPYGGQPIPVLMTSNTADDFYLDKELMAVGTYTFQYKVVWNGQTEYSQSFNVVTVPGCNQNPINTYPYSAGCTNISDAWAFFQGYCTSYVAWKVNEQKGYGDITLNQSSFPFRNHYVRVNGITYNTYTLGHAYEWKAPLDTIYTVNDFPAAGAIAYYGQSGSSPQGHVAYVECVQGNIVTLSEFNGDNTCHFGVRTVELSQPSSQTNYLPWKYIHVETEGMGSVTGVGNVETTATATLFPNPAQTTTNVQLGTQDEIKNIIITDLLGRIIKSINGNETSAQVIDISELQPAVYVLSVRTTEGKSVNLKFTKN